MVEYKGQKFPAAVLERQGEGARGGGREEGVRVGGRRRREGKEKTKPTHLTLDSGPKKREEPSRRSGKSKLERTRRRLEKTRRRENRSLGVCTETDLEEKKSKQPSKRIKGSLKQRGPQHLQR